MWQRFTEQSQRVILQAQEQAHHLGSAEVGTEHLLLALLNERELNLVEAPLEIREHLHENAAKSIRDEILTHAQPPSGLPTSEIRLASPSKRVLELAAAEARRAASIGIGPEHLLLALLRDKKGLAGKLLRDHDIAPQLSHNPIDVAHPRWSIALFLVPWVAWAPFFWLRLDKILPGGTIRVPLIGWSLDLLLTVTVLSVPIVGAIGVVAVLLFSKSQKAKDAALWLVMGIISFAYAAWISGKT